MSSEEELTGDAKRLSGMSLVGEAGLLSKTISSNTVGAMSEAVDLTE